MSQETPLLESLVDGVLTLTMNRPEVRNALNHDMGERLLVALRRAAGDRDVRAVVLTGAGGAFCAGGDVKAMAAGRGAGTLRLEDRSSSLRERAEASRLLAEMHKPTIAVIPGPAAGAGLALALACDFRVAVSSAKFTMAFTKVGLAGDYGATWFLTQLVGAGRARELMMLAPLLTAADAHALGLVNRVWAPESFADECAAFVAALAKGPTIALGYVKHNINVAAATDLRTSFDVEATNQALCQASADHKEAARAFVEKRAASFTAT